MFVYLFIYLLRHGLKKQETYKPGNMHSASSLALLLGFLFFSPFEFVGILFPDATINKGRSLEK